MNILVFIPFALFTNPAPPELKDFCTFALMGIVFDEDTGESLTGALIQFWDSKGMLRYVMFCTQN
jgi:hypothetical protein